MACSVGLAIVYLPPTAWARPGSLRRGQPFVGQPGDGAGRLVLGAEAEPLLVDRAVPGDRVLEAAEGARAAEGSPEPLLEIGVLDRGRERLHVPVGRAGVVHRHLDVAGRVG